MVVEHGIRAGEQRGQFSLGTFREIWIFSNSMRWSGFWVLPLLPSFNVDFSTLSDLTLLSYGFFSFAFWFGFGLVSL